MKVKRFVPWSAGALAVLAAALGSTFLILHRCSFHPEATSLDIATAHLWVHHLHLTEEQQAKLVPLEEALQKELDLLQQKLAVERTDLCALLGNDAEDEKQLDSRLNRVADLEAQQQRRIFRHLQEMRSILTPPQRKAFSTSLMQAVCENCRASQKNGTARCLCQGHEKHAAE